MGLDVCNAFDKVSEGVNNTVNKGNLEYYRGINKICILTFEGTIHLVKTNHTTCKACWNDIMQKGYVEVMVDTSKGQRERILHVSLVKEMFLGSNSL